MLPVGITSNLPLSFGSNSKTHEAGTSYNNANSSTSTSNSTTHAKTAETSPYGGARSSSTHSSSSGGYTTSATDGLTSSRGFTSSNSSSFGGSSAQTSPPTTQTGNESPKLSRASNQNANMYQTQGRSGNSNYGSGSGTDMSRTKSSTSTRSSGSYASPRQYSQPTGSMDVSSPPSFGSRGQEAMTTQRSGKQDSAKTSSRSTGDNSNHSESTSSASTQHQASPPGRWSPAAARKTSYSRQTPSSSSSAVLHNDRYQGQTQAQSPASPSSSYRSPQAQSSSFSHHNNNSDTSPQEDAMQNCDDIAGEASDESPPHLDLATYPPQDLLRVLAALLHQIAIANDQLRPSGGDAGRSGNISDDDNGRRRTAKRTGSSRYRDESRSENSSSASKSGGGRDGGSGDERGRSSETRWSHAGREAYYGDPSPYSPNTGQLRITSAALGALGTPSSTLCFHARNVPSISIESYLLRILKYCPTTNEVFLSLLVYFDRMSRMGLGADPGTDAGGAPSGHAEGQPQNTLDALENLNAGNGDNGISTGGGGGNMRRSASFDSSGSSSPTGGPTVASGSEPHPGMKGFAIDSYNVHRLVIAGVTVASKFFSDVFYTNSRYAKVGGLPVHELNQLELQFLLLNDFKLVIPMDEMQRYADQLLLYGSGQSASNASSFSINSSVSSLGKASALGGSRWQTSAPGTPSFASPNMRIKETATVAAGPPPSIGGRSPLTSAEARGGGNVYGSSDADSSPLPSGNNTSYSAAGGGNHISYSKSSSGGSRNDTYSSASGGGGNSSSYTNSNTGGGGTSISYSNTSIGGNNASYSNTGPSGNRSAGGNQSSSGSMSRKESSSMGYSGSSGGIATRGQSGRDSDGDSLMR